MKLRRGALLLMLAGLLAATACAAPAATAPISGNEPIPGTWVDAAVTGGEVSLPLSLVEQNVNTHFALAVDGRELAFMAYVLEDSLVVRANACPPCRSRGFALDGDILVCDACATTFDARDGSGIAGACVDYPKAEVPGRVGDGSLLMLMEDLVTAYDETLVVG